MTFTVHIPDWVFVDLLSYWLVGVVLYLPLVIWMDRFISPRRKPRQSMREAVRPLFLATRMPLMGVFWPLILQDNLRNEWKWGLGKRWRR